MRRKNIVRVLGLALVGMLVIPIGGVGADQVILDDLIVDGSICVGFDCVNGESFGFDTLRLKENNLRIKFQDTSTSASFPTRDWQITANDTSNGGANKFSIDDIDGGRTPFTIEAGAPSNSLYVDDGGRLGLGTSTPVVDIHVVTGNTPTLRLEQDGSSGFTPQTWDVASNETNFFIRDASNGSTLPFRIRPAAPTSSIDVAATGAIGFGTSSPSEDAHLRRTDDNRTVFLIENTNAQTTGFNFKNNVANWSWRVAPSGKAILRVEGGVQALQVDQTSGDVTVVNNLIVDGQCTEVDGDCAPDYVFEADYELPTLDELAAFIVENQHLPNVPSAAEIAASGVNIRAFSYALLEKIEELTLYTLQQQDQIDDLEARLAQLEAAISGS